MGEYFKTVSAVMLMLLRDGENGKEILLQKRKNTGWADGYYDFGASGHVEDNEPMTVAMCREAKEELGIDIKPEDLEEVCIIHKKSNRIYYNGYFRAKKWSGTPTINEPEKNEELRWVNINEIPENTISDRKQAILNYINKVHYCEMGWDEKCD